MRLMYDSTNVADIPRGAEIVAGYVDGRYQTVKALLRLRRFKNTKIVTITVLGNPGAHVIDCEPGDVTPEHAASWAASEVHAGRRPTIYCSRSTWADVKRAVERLGITGHVDYWIADWTGRAHLLNGAVAVQYADPKTSGGHYDMSVVADHWEAIDGPHAHHHRHKPAKPARPKRHRRRIRVTRAWLLDTTERAVATFAETFGGLFGLRGIQALAGGHWAQAVTLAHTAEAGALAAALAVVKAAFAAKRKGTVSPASAVKVRR